MNTTLKRTCATTAALLGLFLNPALTSSVFAAALASEFTLPVAGIDSVGEIGDAANTRLSFVLTPGGEINAIRWNLNLSAFGTSWLSDLALSLTNSNGDGVTLTPADTDLPGTGNFVGSVWLPDLANHFSLGADGALFLEFHEVLDDAAGADGRWNTGSVTISSVPEPSTLGLLTAAGLATFVALRRRS